MMSNRATALPAEDLGVYEGREVTGATVSISNTGYGFQEAMSVQPVRLPLGERVYLVLECTVEKHRYEPTKEEPDNLQLVNMLKAGRATAVDRDLVIDRLDAQQRRIDEARGQAVLDLDVGDGGPQRIGEVVSIKGEDFLAAVEGEANARSQREVELGDLSKEALLDLADFLDLDVGDLTTTELIDAIVDAELGGDA